MKSAGVSLSGSLDDLPHGDSVDASRRKQSLRRCLYRISGGVAFHA
jgi:hypothetical protein